MPLVSEVVVGGASGCEGGVGLEAERGVSCSCMWVRGSMGLKRDPPGLCRETKVKGHSGSELRRDGDGLGQG